MVATDPLESMENWQKALIAVGAGAAALSLAYLLLRDEPEQASEGSKPSETEEVSKEELVKIIGEIVEVQDNIKARMKVVTKELLAKPHNFEETYAKIKDVHNDEVLEKHGLSMQEFDMLLQKHQNEPEVRMGIMKIMGMSEPGAVQANKSMTVENVISAHKVMLEELLKIQQEVSKKDGLDTKTVSLTAQAITSAKLEAKLGYTSEDMEQAVVQLQEKLATNQEFSTLSMRIQQAFGKMIGAEEGMMGQ